MEFMPYIFGAWIVGMTTYSVFNITIFKNKGKHRCNCKNELIKIKKFENKFNDSSKKQFK
jgi:hypothetical protein